MTVKSKRWTRRTIGSVCQLINGRAFKPTDWTTKGLPIVRIQNLNDPTAPFNHYDGDVRSRFLIESGVLLFAWSGTPGTSFGAHVWNGGPAILNQHIFNVLFDRATVDRDFLKWAINHKLDELIDKAHGGVGLRHVTKGKIEDTELLIPPLEEQRQLVRRVEELSSKSAGARQALKKALSLAGRYKQAVLSRAFAGDMTAEWRRKNGTTLRQWSDSTLGALARDVRYGTATKCHYEPRTTPVLRIPNIQGGKIDTQDLKYAKFSAGDIDKLALQSGDILIIRSNGSVDLVGRSALVTEATAGYLFAGYLIRVRVNQELAEPAFVQRALDGPSIRNAIEAQAKSTSGVNNINSDQLRKLAIPLPPLAEQREILRLVDDAFARVDRAASEAASAVQLLERLDQAALNKAFRGELLRPNVATG